MKIVTQAVGSVVGAAAFLFGGYEVFATMQGATRFPSEPVFQFGVIHSVLGILLFLICQKMSEQK